jgi:formate/nitrite transporter FocA (FNT family)
MVREKELPKKSYQLILTQQIEEGLVQLKRPPIALFLSGISAGLDLGFSILMMTVMLTLLQNVLPGAITHILVSNMYSIGFIFVILGRSELFTEHTDLAVIPVLDGKASVCRLLRLWGIIYSANLIGGSIIAYLITIVGPALKIIDPGVFLYFSQKMTDHNWQSILLSGILAGWLMGLLSWMVTAGRDSMSQIFIVWLITSIIGLAELHHCIAGSIEVLAALFSNTIVSFQVFGHFLLWATTGNIIGGVFFVALLKYSHVKKSESGKNDHSGNL